MVFDPGNPFQPSLMFVSKAGSTFSGAPLWEKNNIT